MFIIVLLFFIGFILISKGADIFINYTVLIGKKTNISELILGATIVSLQQHFQNSQYHYLHHLMGTQL